MQETTRGIGDMTLGLRMITKTTDTSVQFARNACAQFYWSNDLLFHKMCQIGESVPERNMHELFKETSMPISEFVILEVQSDF